jgi:hypothetical protein
MRVRLGALVVSVGVLVPASPALAHHSFQGQYDASKPVTLTGVVTKLEWTNPHAHFYIDVKDEGGRVTSWDLELASPNVLRRLGWTREILKVGDVITVLGSLARDGSKLASARSVALADGRKMDSGSAADPLAPTK